MKNITEYLSAKLPNIVDFVIAVILALIVFFVGAKLIGWFRKLVKRSMERANVDKGVRQFTDSMLKFGLYALLIFSIGKNFGLDTTSVAAVVASGGVAIGLALQGSLSVVAIAERLEAGFLASPSPKFPHFILGTDPASRGDKYVLRQGGK